jgi:hypothetical protein
MKYTLPTLHVLYFGIQAKKGRLDSAGMGKAGSSNIGEDTESGDHDARAPDLRPRAEPAGGGCHSHGFPTLRRCLDSLVCRCQIIPIASLSVCVAAGRRRRPAGQPARRDWLGRLAVAGTRVTEITPMNNGALLSLREHPTSDRISSIHTRPKRRSSQ